jgi:hypothetical protein
VLHGLVAAELELGMDAGDGKAQPRMFSSCNLSLSPATPRVTLGEFAGSKWFNALVRIAALAAGSSMICTSTST